jgi:CBS domain-containing protein/mannitol/fructose-specific phosphotransferase system IIA component (Ntr-type)
VKLSDFITPPRAVVPLEAETLPAAVEVLLSALVASGSVLDVEKLRARVEEERPEDIVAMGDRAFLVHVRTSAVDDLSVSIGTAPKPICRGLGERDETQCARIVLLVAAPPRMATRYLQVIGALAKLLSRESVVADVVAQPDATALAALPAFGDCAIPAQLTVREIMTERPRTVRQDTPLRIAARDMVRAAIGGLPVVDDADQVIGILGERELMRSLLHVYLQQGRSGRATPTNGIGDLTVRDAMTRQVLCVSPEQPLAEVSSIMANKDVDSVPVVHEGRLVGLITRNDIVRKLIGY